ncbi:hypothetical protein C0216_11545 [Streptomyces globosus]|uniref:Uncharacterized protein n=1 Tax=Streptomyces globosus TaxID=68209 RepID=A0A344TZD7_9ACTN|nr:hypothetical protein [Streptomyces sp. 2P-4]AXE24008.1 hypothetical protein C0216_11545 [Streptomyces globosus]
MDENGDKGDTGDEVPRGAGDSTEMLLHVGIAVLMVAWVIILVLAFADSGPVCGTGQDKGPC